MLRNNWPLSYMKKAAAGGGGGGGTAYRYFFIEFITTGNGYVGASTIKCLDSGGTDHALQSNGGTASLIGYTENPSFPVTNVNDGNDTSFTTSDSGGAAGANRGIQIDLGSAEVIETIGLRHRSDGFGEIEAIRTGNIYGKVNAGDGWTLIRSIDEYAQVSNEYLEFPFTIPGTASSTQWRIAIKNTQSGGTAIAREIELRETAGGADTTTGQTATGTGGTPANAIDDNSTSFWQAAGNSFQWLKVVHGAAKAIVEFSWQIHGATGDGIKDVCMQYVNANGAWVSWWYPPSIVWTSADQVQVITK